jgi:hypothetical protein
VTRVKANLSISSLQRQTSVLDVPEETMPDTLSLYETQRAKRLAMLSTCFLVVSTFFI